MKVRELIALLQTFDPEQPVAAYAADEGFAELTVEGVRDQVIDDYWDGNAWRKGTPHVEIIG